MQHAKVTAVIVIIVLASSVVAYEAFEYYQSSNSALAKCERGAANGASGIGTVISGEMEVPSGSSVGNLTLNVKNDACGFVSGVVVMTMRPTLDGSAENPSFPSLITNVSFFEHGGSLVSPSNTIPLGGSATGSISVQNVSANESYTMQIAISFTNANPNQHEEVSTTTLTST
jgi:hypothetical protein